MTPAFARTLSEHGDRLALTGPGFAPATFAELAALAGRMAAALPERKALVAIEAALEPEPIAAYLGALAAGHAVALLPAGDPSAGARFAARFAPEWVCDRGRDGWALRRSHAATGGLHPGLALLLMTSGSTGAGKAVRLSGQALEANAGAIAEALALRPDDRGALVLPLHYSYGLSVLNSHLSVGASLWLHPGGILAPGFARDMGAGGVTTFAGVPYSYELLESAGPLPPVRLMTVAGGRMAGEAVARWAARQAETGGRFAVMYGQTEATARIAILPPDQTAARPDAIGIAVPGGELRLVDDRGRPVRRAGEVGELVYRGPNVMMGYAETRADLSRGAELAELRTGDLASRDAGGIYRIEGRKARFSKIGGVRLGHDALEAALATEGIVAAVVGDDRQVTVFHRAAPCRPVAEIAGRLSGLGPRHLRLKPLADLPRTAAGKTDYARLKDLAAEQTPRGGIAEAMRDCFFPVPVGAQDTFVSLGGDSLRHVEMTLELQRCLGHVPEGWERMTLSELQAAPAPRKGWPKIGTDVVLRAMAILAVVVQHQTGLPVWGGAAAMVILIGHSLARFQHGALTQASWGAVFRPLARVLGAYYLIVAGYALAWGQVPWASVALVGNFGLTTPETHLMLPYLYWFVEAYAQMLLVFAAPFLLPQVRAFVARAPFRYGLILLALAVAARLLLPHLWDIGNRKLFSLPWVFWLCALGWCIAFARSAGQRAVVLAAAAVTMAGAAWIGGNWYGAWIKYGSLGLASAALILCPRITLPHAVQRLVVPLAQAAFYIYLAHRWMPEVIMPALGTSLSPVATHVAAIAGGIALGFAGAALQRGLTQSLSRAKLASGRAESHSPRTAL
jgi:acyl-CoA synthetase (AMP-forming)/AMP-acid ligase II